MTTTEFTTNLSDDARLIRHAIKRYFRWATNQRIDYDDLVQAGWVARERALADFDQDKGAWSSFLINRVRGEIGNLVDHGFTALTTASHHFTAPGTLSERTLAMAHAGKQTATIGFTDPEGAPTIAADHIAAVDDQDERDNLWNRLGEIDLGDRQRQILDFIRNGKEVAEIATELGITESGVRIARDRAIAKIREAIGA